VVDGPLKKGVSMSNRTKWKVLCVCRGDILRGPMMQARLQSLLDENLFRVESAGFERKSLGRHRVHPSVVACMEKRGIDIGKHQSHYIARLQHLEDYSVFVCVTPDVAERVQGLLTEIKHSALVIVANRVRGGVTDPHEAVESVEACASLIDEVSPGIADQIRSYVGTQSQR
jgi:protein-tyrosine-phosphatase